MMQPTDITNKEIRVECEVIPSGHSTRQLDPRGIREAVAARLKQARLSMKLTQKEAAKRADKMPLPSYKGYEAALKMPGGEAIQALTKLGINANWLLTGEGPMLLSELLSEARQDLLDAHNLQKTADGIKSSPAQDIQPHENHVAKQLLVEYSGDQDNLMATKRLIGGPEPACDPSIDEGMLNACHNACRSAYGGVFDEQPAPVQFGYAVDLYNLLVKMSAQYGGLEQMKRLETAGVADLLNVFIRLGWAKKFPPPPPGFFF